MSLLIDVARAVGATAGKLAVEVVKTGHQIGKSTGEGVVKGTVNGTIAVVKEIVKQATDD